MLKERKAILFVEQVLEYQWRPSGVRLTDTIASYFGLSYNEETDMRVVVKIY